MLKRQKQVMQSIQKLDLGPRVQRVLYEIWDEVDSAYYTQNQQLRRDGIRLLNLTAELVVALDANGKRGVVSDKLRKQIIKMRRTWQGK